MDKLEQDLQAIFNQQKDTEIVGLVAVREWEFDGLLKSTIADYHWRSAEVTSDQVPAINNSNGIYCRILKDYKEIDSNFAGIVELRGRILLHTDNILRAEWCRISRLFIRESENTDAILPQLHAIYGVPMVVTNSIHKSIEKWLAGEGKSFLKSNEKIIKERQKTIETLYGKPDVLKEKYNIKPSGTLLKQRRQLYPLYARMFNLLALSSTKPSSDPDDTPDKGNDESEEK